MGIIFRLPFYLVGVFIWLPIGMIIGGINIITLPIFGIASVLAPSYFPNKAKDILSLGTLRRGINSLNIFLRGNY